jgi:transposase
MPKRLTIPALDAATLTAVRECYDMTDDPRLRLRCQMVLLAQQGRSVAQIAEIVFHSRDTVERTLHAWLSGGLEALPRRIAKGPTPIVTAAWTDELVRVIERDPHDLGVPSANWTTELLASYLAEHTAIAVGAETVRLYLHAHDYVCKRPTWSLKRKAEEQPGYVGNA